MFSCNDIFLCRTKYVLQVFLSLCRLQTVLGQSIHKSFQYTGHMMHSRFLCQSFTEDFRLIEAAKPQFIGMERYFCQHIYPCCPARMLPQKIFRHQMTEPLPFMAIPMKLKSGNLLLHGFIGKCRCARCKKKILMAAPMAKNVIVHRSAADTAFFSCEKRRMRQTIWAQQPFFFLQRQKTAAYSASWRKEKFLQGFFHTSHSPASAIKS